MSQGRPSPETLLAAVREHLENTVQPVLRGAQGYQNRVAVNLLRVLERELRMAPAVAAPERARLAQLLDAHGSRDELDTELCRRIRARQLDYRNEALLDHLDRVALARVAIDNPAYSAYRRATAQGPGAG